VAPWDAITTDPPGYPTAVNPRPITRHGSGPGTGSSTRAQKRAINAGLVKRSLTLGSIFLGMNCILPTHKDAASNLGRFTGHCTHGVGRTGPRPRTHAQRSGGNDVWINFNENAPLGSVQRCRPIQASLLA